MGKKLNVGCGNQILSDCINIDNIPYCKDVYLDDVIHLKNFEDNSVDFVYASHVLQCIFPRSKVPEALKNWYRVLKSGGHIVIEVPNVMPLMKKYLNNEVSHETFVQGIYGIDKDGIRQFTCFSYSYLEKLLKDTGFKDVKQIKQPSYSRHDPNTNLVVEAWK